MCPRFAAGAALIENLLNKPSLVNLADAVIYRSENAVVSTWKRCVGLEIQLYLTIRTGVRTVPSVRSWNDLIGVSNAFRTNLFLDSLAKEFRLLPRISYQVHAHNIENHCRIESARFIDHDVCASAKFWIELLQLRQ